MDAPPLFTCDLTSERIDRAEPELAAALSHWAAQHQQVLADRRARLEPRLRLAGLALSALGAVLSGAAVALLPDEPCPAAGTLPLFQVATPLFVALGVIFWFLPELTARLRGWASAAAARRAPRLLAPLRAGLPSTVAYRVSEGRLSSSLTRPARRGTTRLADVAWAVLGVEVACLFGRPPRSRLLRVVWLAGPAERHALEAVLVASGVTLVALPGRPAAGPRRAPDGGAGAAR